MAIINKTGISEGGTIQAEHITRAIDALSGVSSDTVVATGSFTGSFTGAFSGTITSASFATTASHAVSALSSSYALTASYVSMGNSPTASFVTASGVYGPYGANSIISASNAATASTFAGQNALYYEYQNLGSGAGGTEWLTIKTFDISAGATYSSGVRAHVEMTVFNIGGDPMAFPEEHRGRIQIIKWDGIIGGDHYNGEGLYFQESVGITGASTSSSLHNGGGITAQVRMYQTSPSVVGEPIIFDLQVKSGLSTARVQVHTTWNTIEHPYYDNPY